MISGIFLEDAPVVRVAIAGRRAVLRPVTVLDTGFSGDIQITPKMARELGLEVRGVMSAQVANGSIVQVLRSAATAAMEGEMSDVDVLISDGVPLVGVGFLSKFSYKAVVDCKNKTVALEMVD